MAVIKMKPTSPGQRGVVKVSRDHVRKAYVTLKDGQELNLSGEVA